MRVISGNLRGLKLNAPKNDDVRPTTDRVKESMFNVINMYIMESSILDLFAGTGSLGIECLSRGANDCVFVDLNRESLQVVNSNIKKARLEQKSTVMNLSYKDAISKLSIQNKKFDVIFMDPPYYKDMFIDALTNIDQKDILQEEGIIVVEHDTKENLADKVGRLEKFKSKKYGNTTISLYQMEV